MPRLLPDVVRRHPESPFAAIYAAKAAFAAAGSGLHHKICHVLGGAYDLPHAEMHTVVLPHALALVERVVRANGVRVLDAQPRQAEPLAHPLDAVREQLGAPQDHEQREDELDPFHGAAFSHPGRGRRLLGCGSLGGE